MSETNGSFVENNENFITTTTVYPGNSTENQTDQILSGKPVHEDDTTVSVVLIPLLVIGFLIAVTAIIFIVIRRRTAKQARRQFAPVYYSVEHEESGNEWESQLMDEELAKHASIVKPNRGHQARLQFERGGT